MDTEYTKGFKAGLAWEQERTIKLLEEEFNDTWPTGVAFVETSLPNLIELIKGETKPFLTSSQVGQMVDEMLEE